MLDSLSKLANSFVSVAPAQREETLTSYDFCHSEGPGCHGYLQKALGTAVFTDGILRNLSSIS